MGKISSYGTASAPSLGDKLIGTSVGGSPVNGTYNFTIQQLADLISGQVTLQKVLNTGNTATQNIIITNYIKANYFENTGQNAFYLSNAGNNDFTLTSSGIFRILNNTQTTSLFSVANDGSVIISKLEVNKLGGSNVSIVATTSGSASLTLTSNTTGSKKAIINAPLASGALVFQTQNTDRMFIDSFGSLIINSPISVDSVYKLQVTGSSIFKGLVEVYNTANITIVGTYKGLFEYVDNLVISAFDNFDGSFVYGDGNLKVYSSGAINMISLPSSPSSTYGDLYVDGDGFVKMVL